MKQESDFFIVIGGSKSHISFIEAANKLGYETVVFDRNPLAPGADMAGRFYSISTHDVEGILSMCHQLVEKKSIAGIITYSSDVMPLKVTAQVSNAFGLNSFSKEAVDNTTDKIQMKSKLSKANIPMPEWTIVSSWNEAKSFFMDSNHPLILKPAVGGVGSSGVSMVTNENEFTSAFEAASKISEDGKVILEKFYKAREFNVGGVVNKNKTTVLVVSEKFNLGPAQNFVTSRFTTGRSLDIDFKKSVSDIIKPVLQAIKAVEIDNSFFSADVLLTDKGSLVLEIGLLLDVKIDRLLYFAGIDVYDMRCKIAVGDEINYQPLNQSKGYALNFMYADRSGRLLIENGLNIKLKDNGIMRINVGWEKEDGDMVCPPKSVADILGWIIVESSDQMEASFLAKKMIKTGLFNLKSLELNMSSLR